MIGKRVIVWALLVFVLALLVAWPTTAMSHPAAAQTARAVAGASPTPSPSPGVDSSVALSGILTLIWGDEQRGPGAATPLVILTEDSGRRVRLLLSDESVASLGGYLALNRQRVVASGRWEGQISGEGGLSVLRAEAIRLDAGAAPAGLAATGTLPWVSVLCKFADVAAEPKTLSYFGGMFANAYPGMDHYFRESSYDLANVQGSAAFGWYTLPHPRSYYVYGDPVRLDWGRAAEDCTAVADADVYFPSYTGVNLMFNDNLDCCAWGGGWSLNRDGVSKGYAMTWEPPWGYSNAGIIAHEMSHGFGIPHSNGGNVWDGMMSVWSNCNPSDPVYGCLAEHTIAYHKDLVSWMPAERRYTVALDTPVTLTLERLALPLSGAALMAKIPIAGAVDHFYTVEARRRAGYDNLLLGEAVIIHEIAPGRPEPAHVVDADQDGDYADDGAMWLPGESFVDATNGISITVSAVTASGYQVAILARRMPWQLAPSDGVTVTASTVRFSWTAVPGAAGYEIQIDTSSSFSSPHLITAGTSATSYSVPLAAGDWYWRVRTAPGGAWVQTWLLHARYVWPVVQASPGKLDDYEPALAAPAPGQLLLVYERSGQLMQQSSSDDGAAWSAAERIAECCRYQPALLKANDRRLWLVFRKDGQLWYRTSSDNGATWAAEEQLTSRPAATVDPEITQMQNGDIWVVWAESNTLWYKSTANGGAVWSAARQIPVGSDWKGSPSIAQAGNGTIWLVWFHGYGLAYSTSSDGGDTWSAYAFMNAGGPIHAPHIRRASNGVLWLVYPITRNEAARWRQNLYYQTSSDNGATWSGPIQFTRFVGDNNTPAWVALDGGRMAVAWQSNRSAVYKIWLGIPGVRDDLNPPPFVSMQEHLPAGPDSGSAISFRARAQDETSVMDMSLAWSLDGDEQPELSMYDDGAHGDDAAGDGLYGALHPPFSAGQEIAYQAQAVDGSGNSFTYYPATSFDVLPSFSKSAPILLVADAGGADSAWISGYYTAALSALGYSYDLWDTGQRGAAPTATLSLYGDGIILWAMPTWGYAGSDQGQIAALRSYLDGGGSLLISGQNVAESLASSNPLFLSDYLHATYVQADTALTSISGQAGDPIGDGMALVIAGGDGANDQYSRDEVNAVAPAVSFLTYNAAAPAAVQGNLSSGGAGLRVEAAGYRVVFLAFGFEAVAARDGRLLLMERALTWLGRPPSGDIYRINCGGPGYKDGANAWWSADRSYVPGLWGYVGGAPLTTTVPISNTSDDILYQSGRTWAATATPGYRFTVTNGRYEVMLRYAETKVNAAGLRRFHVLLEDVQAFGSYDIFSKAGGRRAARDEVFQITVADGVLDIGFVAVTGQPKVNAIQVRRLSSAPYARRVNAGGAKYTDGGVVWAADRAYSAGSWGYTGVATGTLTVSALISGTSAAPLYQTERNSMSAYQFTVANGVYRVTLKFAENSYNRAGKRVFNVKLETTRVLSSFDIWVAAGGRNAAVDRSFTTVVSDKLLTITFAPITGKAKVSAIEVLQQ